MSEAAEQLTELPIAQMMHSPTAMPAEVPIVIIGNGPVGMRVAQELLKRLPDAPLVIYGEERHEPYNRVRLSSWLVGELDWNGLAQPLRQPLGTSVDERMGYRITRIDRNTQTITDNTGREQVYRQLILATGSSPFIPSILDLKLSGVFTFRDLDDANKLLARRASSHHTIVLGGGLLGLEAARGMQPGNTSVTVVEHADRLLGRQLDEPGATRLKHEVEGMGIKVVVGDGVAEVLGKERVTGVRLRSGQALNCDTMIVATGIRPNIALARQARLAFGSGIQVDDAMRTNDPNIYAVGECAEHRGQVYGLVAPGLEQAAVAASTIAGIESQYHGSIAASRLKVVGTDVFSMGPMGAEGSSFGVTNSYKDGAEGIYRKILVHKHRLVGAIGIGEWNETVRLQTVIGHKAIIWPWQRLRFLRTGRIWPQDEGQDVAAWPATALVCQCTGVTRGAISEAVAQGASCVEDVSSCTGASTVCGSCKPLVQDLLGVKTNEPAPMAGVLLVSAVIALLGALGFLVGPVLAYADSVQQGWHWDQLWRDQLFKQISGFSVLGVFAVGLLIALRKRIKRFSKLGSFDNWRLVHIVLGVLVIVGLVAHTGFRMGEGLNLALMLSFSLMLALGALLTGVIALEHRIGGALALRLRKQSLWLHILLFWPVPALLGWHVFKGYWF